jgi:hypothetical protein
MMVSVNGARPLEQNELESATKSPFLPTTSQDASTTLPICAVPHWSTL